MLSVRPKADIFVNEQTARRHGATRLVPLRSAIRLVNVKSFTDSQYCTADRWI